MTLMGEYITPGDLILNGILALAGLAVLWSLWALHRRNGRYNNFNLVYLIVNKDGFPDGAKCIEMALFLILSWGFISYVTKGNLPEWYMISYTAIFASRAGYGAYLRAKGAEPPETPGTKVTTEVVTTAKTTEVKP